MTQRVRKPHRGQSPSSVTQLPILTALHARLPTLFVAIIHYNNAKVNIYFQRNNIFCYFYFDGGRIPGGNEKMSGLRQTDKCI